MRPIAAATALLREKFELERGNESHISLPGPCGIRQPGSKRHAGKLCPSTDTLPLLHVEVVRLCHIERLGRLLLRVSHVISPLYELLSCHGLYRSCAKHAGFTGPVSHKRYKTALLREKFGSHQGHCPHFLSWCAL